jgi:predicted ArsR family transcriptional regulator
MNQTERDRLDAMKGAKKKVITQKQAAEEIGVTERQVRRLLRKLRRRGDHTVIHELRGRASNRKRYRVSTPPNTPPKMRRMVGNGGENRGTNGAIEKISY